MNELRLHRFLPSTFAEGPGRRACVWVQGCSIHCRGCAVPWTWDPQGGTAVKVDELAGRILTESDLEGITFLGGEPFNQAAGLAELARLVKAAGLSVMTFSGYTLEHLRAAQRPEWNQLLELTDLLIDGPFRQQQLDISRPWVGSSNQRYHFLTERYRHLKDELGDIPNRLEIRISPDGEVQVNGLATQEEIRQLMAGLVF